MAEQSVKINTMQYLHKRWSKITHYCPVFPFYTPLKHQKTKGFLMFSGGIKRKHPSVMD